MVTTRPEMKVRFTVRQGRLHLEFDEPIYDRHSPYVVARLDAKVPSLTPIGSRIAPAIMALLDEQEVDSLTFRRAEVVVSAEASSFARLKLLVLTLIEETGFRAVERDGGVLRYRPRQCTRHLSSLRRTIRRAPRPRRSGAPVNDD